MQRNAENPLSILIAEQLSSVIFVQDYLQLDFDGHCLTCYIWPIILVNGTKYQYGNVQYRNKLCAIISNLVKQIALEESKSLKIIFESKNEIFLPLDYTDQKIKEIANFKDLEGNWSFF